MKVMAVIRKAAVNLSAVVRVEERGERVAIRSRSSRKRLQLLWRKTKKGTM
jgi:hypothetical protein